MTKANILIVEDEHIIAMDIRNYLERGGYQIAGHLDTGEHVLQAARELKPDLILMDIRLKGKMDGIEAATSVRTELDVPVIFLTSYTNQSTLERARMAEPFAYIVKPFDEQALSSNIEIALYKHEMEKKLRVSENRFRSVIENASEGIALLDNHGNIIEWNPAIETITGLKSADVLDRPVWEAVFQITPRSVQSPEFQKLNADAWKSEVKNGFKNKDTNTEYEIETPEGERRIILNNGFVFETNEGWIAGVIMRDITQQRLVDLEIRKTRNELEATLNATPDLMFELGFDGRYYRYHSPRNDLLYAPPEFFLGKTIDEVLPIDAATIVMSALEEAELKGYSSGRQLSLDLPQGRVWFELSVSRMTEVAGQGNHFIVLSRDITDRKNAEEDLRKKNLELERFTYTVSHDLKAPLVTINGFLHLLEQDILTNRTDRIKSDMQHITAATQKMERMLNELLELSRVGRVINTLRDVRFEDIARDALDLVAGRLSEKGVQVHLEPGLPVVFCDRSRLTQVMQNLIDNAVKFMGTQPEPQIWIGQRSNGAQLTFFVRDNGIGIDPENQERVFGLFNRLDTNEDGTGIGLALVQRIIETHGGKVWVESEGLGKGSTFCFTLTGGMVQAG
jgi:PAS domain S-box-containing protein